MTEHRIGTTDDLPEDGSRLIAEVNGREIAVFRIDGEFHAVLNFCVHEAGPLCEGELTGRIVQEPDEWMWDYADRRSVVVCPWHSWKFDVTTGRCIDDERYAVPTYEVIEDDGDLLVRT